MKSKRMRWTGHAVRIGYRRNAYGIFIIKSEGKRPLGRSVVGKIILKRISGK
jgi:hypothetical protein